MLFRYAELMLCPTGVVSAVEGRPISGEVRNDLGDMVLATVDVGMKAVEACKHDNERVSMRSQLMFEIFSNILPTLRGILEVTYMSKSPIASIYIPVISRIFYYHVIYCYF